MKRFVAVIIASAAVLMLSGCGGDTGDGGGGDESNTTSSTVVPTLAASTGTVAENSAAGTSVGTVTVSDTGDSAITAITLSGTGNENFSVSTAGAITVASGASLDYESTTNYALKAKATNDAGDSAEVDVTITVTNVAETAPTLSAFIGSVAENSATGTSVGTITISDAGDSAISAITLSGTGSDNFSVSTTGAITVASGASLDYESTTIYALKAKATNGAGDSSEVDVTISVTNVAETPTLAASTGEVVESATSGASAGSITITDTGDSAISAITISGVDSTKFSVDTSGAITVAGSVTFDYATKSTYALRAKATNGAGDSAEVDVTITILKDTDGDGISDRDDPDDDNDGISDRNEQADGTDPLDASSLFRPFKILVEANDDLEFTVPVASDYSYSYRIDCDDDGVYEDIDTDVNKTEAHTCSLGSEGNHTITISGNFPHIYFWHAADKAYLLSVKQWGDVEWKSFKNAFGGCSNMIIQATDTPDLSHVNNMSYAFYGASTMNQDIGDWNVSNVTDMGAMFRNAVTFDQNLSEWDVSNVSNMTAMFLNASEFNQDVGDWNVSNVTSMNFMFKNATSFDQNLSRWDVTGNPTHTSFADGGPIEGTTKEPNWP